MVPPERARTPYFFLLAALALATLSVYLPALDAGFYNYDDDVYVTANAQVQRGISVDGMVWAWTTRGGSNWHPLTWMSHMLDCEFFQLNPKYHHLTSILLHALNALLLFVLFQRMTGALWESGFVAAVFALHPLHIESVVWIAERKDVLSTVFWMTTLLAYSGYVRRPTTGRMTLVVLSFALGLTAKPMLVSLPCILLLLDIWPLRRFAAGSSPPEASGRRDARTVPFSRLLVEKIPLAVLAVASSIITFLVQNLGGSTKFGASIPLQERLSNGVIAYVKYISKTFVPRDLSIFYPYPRNPHPWWEIFLVLGVLAGVTWGALHIWRRHPFVLVGWLWFIVTLIPVIGIVQVGWQSMADRYMYIPMIGLTIIIAWGAPLLLGRIGMRSILIGALSILSLSALWISTRQELMHWTDSIALFDHARQVTDGNWLALNNLGAALGARGRETEALPFLEKAVELKPDYAEAHHNLGILYASRMQNEKALIHYNEALRLQPRFPGLQYDIGYCFYRQGKSDSAAAHFEEAVRVNPLDVRARYILGTIRTEQRDYAGAMEQFSGALSAKPDFSLAAEALEKIRKMVRDSIR